MKKAVVFDFFGVICNEVGLPWFERNFSQDSFNDLKESKCRPLDKGEIAEADFFNDVGSLAGTQGSEVRKEWINTVVINKEVLELINKLKNNGIKVTLLSNAASSFVREILTSHQLEGYFEDIVVSAEVGMAKPDIEIFEFVLERNKIQPEETVFIDDNSHNVAAAESIGIHGIVFKSHSQLNLDLTDLQLFS